MTSRYTFRVEHPRSTYPTIRVFRDCALLLERDCHRDDLPEVRSRLERLLPEADSYAYPIRFITDTIDR